MQPNVPGYVVLGLVGRGATGEVWRAQRQRDGLPVAVKVLAQHASDAPGGGTSAGRDVADDPRVQLLREVTVLGRAVGEHLVRLHEVVPLADGSLALVLDLADGGSLARVVAGRGHLSAGETVTVLAPLAEALADLHDAGVVHADLSAGNVLFTREGKPLLADLGVSRVAGEPAGDTHATAGFVAPEVAAGAAPSPAADVYSLGALGWLALTGAVPPPPALRPPLSTVLPGAPPPLVAVLEWCLLAVDERPSAREVAVAVFDATQAEPVRLATGSDPASELTHRLRAEAAAQPSLPPVPSRWRAMTTLRGRLAGLSRRVGRQGRPHRPGPRPRLWPRLTRRRHAAVVGGVLAVALLGVSGAWAASRHGPGASPAEAAVPRVAAGQSPTTIPRAGGVRAVPSGGHVTDRQAPVTASRELLQELADRRAAAWVARDPARLLEVDAPGSPAWRSDAAQVASLLSHRAVYRGLRHTVREATGTLSGTTATLSARVDTAAYTVVVGQGRPQARPAAAGATLTFTLRWTSGGWRIVSYR